jgi:hypothetical protein
MLKDDKIGPIPESFHGFRHAYTETLAGLKAIGILRCAVAAALRQWL